MCGALGLVSYVKVWRGRRGKVICGLLGFVWLAFGKVHRVYARYSRRGKARLGFVRLGDVLCGKFRYGRRGLSVLGLDRCVCAGFGLVSWVEVWQAWQGGLWSVRAS